MKKWKYFTFIVATMLFFAFAGCSPEDPELSGEDGPSVTISVPSASLDLYETLQLIAHAENTEEAIVWESSDPARATVEDGLVTAIATGNARITASAGGASAVCAVMITDSQAAPVLSVSDTDVRLETGTSLTVTASVMLKGEKEENVRYSWMGGGSVVSVEANGERAIIKGLTAGTTEVYVSATVRGIYVAQKIDVTVSALGIVFDIANCTPGTEGAYSADLYTLATDTYPDMLIPELTIYENGGVVSEPDVGWVSDNDNIVRVDENGAFVAVAEGKASVVCRYKEASVKVDITVMRTRVPLSGHVVAEEMNLQPVRLTEKIEGNVIDATFKGVSVFGSFDAANNELTLSETNFPHEAANLGEGELVISTEKADYVVSAEMYTLIIHDSAELDSMRGIGEGAEGYICDGYYILANDIVYTGASFIPLAPEGVVWRGGSDALAGNTGGFRGVFDGKGHTITGLKFDLSVSTRAYNGMFGVLHREGVVQNVAFEDASVCGALIAYYGSGTVRNIYVRYASIRGGTDGHYAGTVYTGGASLGAAVEAVFIDASDPNAYIGTDSSNTRLIGCGVGSTAVYNGVYVISPSSLRSMPVTNANGADVYAAFRTYADFLKDSSSQNVVSAWEQSIWTTDSNGCPIFR